MIVHLLLVAHPFILKYGIAEYHHSSSTSAAAAVYTAVHGKSVIARDRERQPSTNQITALTRATPAIYQSYLPDGRNHPAYIAHRTCRRTYKNAHHTAAHATMDVRSRHRTSPRLTRFVLGKASEYRRRSRSYHVDPLSRRREVAHGVLCSRPNLNKLFFSPRSSSERRGIEIFCRLFSTDQPTTQL